MTHVGESVEFKDTEYVIERELGTGGFCTVFQAVSKNSLQEPRDIAVKIPHPNRMKNDSFRQRFEREVLIAGNIQHGNVARTYGGTRLANGDTAILQEYLHNAQPFDSKCYSQDTSDFLSACLQLLYALRAIHDVSPGVVHRDISPNNVLILPCGKLKVIDFGLAKPLEPGKTVLTRDGTALGTEGYRSPEQGYDSATVDHRSDLFSAGQVIGNALRGHRPRTMGGQLDDFVDKMTAHTENRRYQSSDDAIQALLSTVVKHRLRVSHADIHFRELANSDCEIVAEFLFNQIALMERLSHDELSNLYLLNESILARDRFRIDTVFERLNREAIYPKFFSQRADFEQCDPLGRMLKEWLPHLGDEKLQAEAFKLLVDLAVKYHRFFVMNLVRNAYSEASDDLKQEFTKILKERDSAAIIESRGVLPER